MKLAVLASLIGAASAFAPASTGVKTTALNAEKSQALPFLPAPENLKGYVGDVGFDPLRISDYVPMDYLREAELKHGRICMLAWTGYVAVDVGLRITGVPAELASVSSLEAHNAAVVQGGLGQIFLGIAALEMVSWLSISAMLQGSGRAPGDFGLGTKFLPKDEAKIEEMKLKELKNGRLAMMAFSGVVTQNVLTGSGFPYAG